MLFICNATSNQNTRIHIHDLSSNTLYTSDICVSMNHIAKRFETNDAIVKNGCFSGEINEFIANSENILHTIVCAQSFRSTELIITSNPVHSFNIFTMPLSPHELVKSKQPPSFSSLKIGFKFLCFFVQNRHKLLNSLTLNVVSTSIVCTMI